MNENYVNIIQQLDHFIRGIYVYTFMRATRRARMYALCSKWIETQSAFIWIVESFVDFILVLNLNPILPMPMFASTQVDIIHIICEVCVRAFFFHSVCMKNLFIELFLMQTEQMHKQVNTHFFYCLLCWSYFNCVFYRLFALCFFPVLRSFAACAVVVDDKLVPFVLQSFADFSNVISIRFLCLVTIKMMKRWRAQEQHKLSKRNVLNIT